MTDDDVQQQIEQVEKHLPFLIQDEGLTRQRLEKWGGPIMELWAPSSAAHVWLQLQVLLTKITPADKHLYALRVALDASRGSSLTERRTRLRTSAVAEEAVFSGKSEDTLRRWERSAMNAFARQIVEYSMRSQAYKPTPVEDRVSKLEQEVEALREAVLQLQQAR